MMERTLFLGIETSCDETAAAVVDEELRILSNIVATQTELHRRFGGVVPEMASRAHVQRILPVIASQTRFTLSTWLTTSSLPSGEKSAR